MAKKKEWKPTVAYGIRVPTGFFIFHGHDPKVDYHCGNDSFIIPISEAHEKQLQKFQRNQSPDFRVVTTKVFLRLQTPDGVNHWDYVRPVEPEAGDEALRDAEDAAGVKAAEAMTEMATAKPKARGKKGGK
jgi:hypothetical protein